jgi:hypothetical protein
MLYKGEGIEITPEVFRNLKVGDILSNKYYSTENDGSLGYDYEVIGKSGNSVTIQLLFKGSRGGYYTLTEQECIDDTQLYLLK